MVGCIWLKVSSVQVNNKSLYSLTEYEQRHLKCYNLLMFYGKLMVWFFLVV